MALEHNAQSIHHCKWVLRPLNWLRKHCTFCLRDFSFFHFMHIIMSGWIKLVLRSYQRFSNCSDLVNNPPFKFIICNWIIYSGSCQRKKHKRNSGLFEKKHWMSRIKLVPFCTFTNVALERRSLLIWRIFDCIYDSAEQMVILVLRNFCVFSHYDQSN